MSDGDLSLPVGIGEVVAGKYRISRVVAQGGNGVVYAAKHLALGHDVALKCLLQYPLRGPEAVPRFQQEARAVVVLKSEHVVRVSDVGVLEDGDPFIVMELLDGVDLKTVIEGRGRIDLREVADFMIQLCEAIAEAHEAGIVHRDIKPANLFVATRMDGSPFLKVLDFGVAKVADRLRVAGSNTATGSVLGSVAYMAPEQALSSKDVDRRVDIWAIGAVMYELLTGEPPFLSKSIGELLNKIANGPTPPLRAKRPDVPSSLEHLVNRCLEKKRDHRPFHVGEIVLALAPFASGSVAGEIERTSKLMAAATLVPQEAGFRSTRALPPPPVRDSELPQIRLTGPSPPPGTPPPGYRTTTPPPSASSGVILVVALAFVLVMGTLGACGAYRGGFLHRATHAP